MSPRAYYNEIDPYAAQWLRNLMAAGLITAGEVDTRSIVDVRPSDLDGFDRCHFFAGIGVWDCALDRAGWGDRPVWSGSCPCQPFSTAGNRAGIADERHLWPVWYQLIRARRPDAIVGEQVASAQTVGGSKPSTEPAWIDAVFADLEAAHYACGAADIPAAGVGAPNIRQRLWFVAHALGERIRGEGSRAARAAEGGMQSADRQRERLRADAGSGRIDVVRAVADASGERWERGEFTGETGASALGSAETQRRRPAGLRQPAGHGSVVGMGNATEPGPQRLAHGGGTLHPQCPAAERAGGDVGGGLGGPAGSRRERIGDQPAHGEPMQTGALAGFWADAEWIPCRDGKARPIEPGTFPLAHGIAGRVGRLRAYGNATRKRP